MLNFIRNLTDPWYLLQLLMTIPIVLFSLTIHECSHGYFAYRLGDPTARNLGRLTLNPVKHLDPIGTIAMVLFGIGWAKPVPINTRYFKKPKRDMALTALAGPVSNFLLSFIVFAIGAVVNEFIPYDSIAAVFVLQWIMLFSYLNLYLAVFNLIPIPPFDGSRIAFALLPDKVYFGVMKYERIIMLVMLILLMWGLFSGPLQLLTGGMTELYIKLFSLIPFFDRIGNLVAFI